MDFEECEPLTRTAGFRNVHDNEDDDEEENDEDMQSRADRHAEQEHRHKHKTPLHMMASRAVCCRFGSGMQKFPSFFFPSVNKHLNLVSVHTNRKRPRKLIFDKVICEYSLIGVIWHK